MRKAKNFKLIYEIFFNILVLIIQNSLYQLLLIIVNYKLNKINKKNPMNFLVFSQTIIRLNGLSWPLGLLFIDDWSIRPIVLGVYSTSICSRRICVKELDATSTSVLVLIVHLATNYKLIKIARRRHQEKKGFAIICIIIILIILWTISSYWNILFLCARQCSIVLKMWISI